MVWHSADPTRMRRVLTAWDEHLADPHLPRRLARLLRTAGFAVTRRPVTRSSMPATTQTRSVPG